MMGGLFLSRVLGIVRDMIMAGKFGRGPETDAYVLAFQIPDLLFFLIAGGALSTSFIPVFSEYLHTGREKDAWKLFSSVVTLMSVVVAAFIAAAWIFAEPLMRLAAPEVDPALVPQIVRMSRILLPAQFAFFVGGILFGTLYARQKFVAPGLGPNIYNIGIILGALVVSQFVEPGIVGMAWGALFGALIGNLVVPAFVMRKLGGEFRISFDLKHPGVKKVFRLMLPVVLGLSLPGVYAMIMRALGTGYDAGVVTSLDYANKLMQAPLGIFGQSLAIAVFPALTQFFAQGEMGRFRAQLESSLRTVLYITVPISALMAVLAEPIVATVYEHGRFGAADTAVTADALRLFSLGVFAWCLHPVLMRSFFALQRTVPPIVVGTLTTGLFLLLAFTLQATPLGWAALPLASSISAIALVVALILVINKSAGGIDLASIFSTFAKCVLGAAAGAAVAWLSVTYLPHFASARKLDAVLHLLIAGLAGAWAYYFVSRLLKMKEAGTIDRALARLSRKEASPDSE